MKTSLLVALLCIVVAVVIVAVLLHSRRSSSMYRRRFVNGAPMRERHADSRADDINAAVLYPVIFMSSPAPHESSCDAGSSGAGDGSCAGGGGAD
jgi:FtsZ-interacting cell division protein ZipA